jgi:hypothetical protein
MLSASGVTLDNDRAKCQYIFPFKTTQRPGLQSLSVKMAIGRSTLQKAAYWSAER